uniref:Uncharacterized protein n=1 Tax=mine drainage metagenome TaxID=410659 RepID=E6Q9D9_9ZZZZ
MSRTRSAVTPSFPSFAKRRWFTIRQARNGDYTDLQDKGGASGFDLSPCDRLESRYRRDGRAAEGAPLLREYGAKHSIEGSNPSLSATLTGLKS